MEKLLPLEKDAMRRRRASDSPAPATTAILLTGTSPGMEVGVDGYSWKIGPRFGGVRVEFGELHLLVVAPSQQNSNMEGLGRQGIWLYSNDTALAKAWSAKDECVVRPELPPGSIDAMRLAAASGTIPGLGTLPPSHVETWRRLSRHITQFTVERCGMRLDEPFSCSESEEPSWTRIPDVDKTGLDPSCVTRAHMDGSERTRKMAKTYCEDDLEEILGELELAFVLFLAMGSLSGLDRWRRLVALLCSCDDLMKEEAKYFEELSESLREQLLMAPPDFFRDPIGRAEDALRPALANLFETFDGAEPLFEFVRDRFGLYERVGLGEARERRIFDDERSEAPVVTDLDSSSSKTENKDPRAELVQLGFENLAAVIDPDREDSTMAAMRILDDEEEGSLARADAVGYLESLVVTS